MDTLDESIETPIDPIQDFLQWTVLDNPYIPMIPSPVQSRFLLTQEDEVLFGGAGGGGKSFSLLAAALQFVMLPQYDALILRRSFPDLTQPRALIPIAEEWLRNTDAKYRDREHRWEFPSGATLTFGHMNSDKDKYRYQGAGFNYIGFDELTQFTLPMYLYLFSRLRRGKDINIPGRMRAASNPGGEGHEWVRDRFLMTPPNISVRVFDEKNQKDSTTRVFIPAKMTDNPSLDQEDYRKKLSMLDMVTRAQIEEGDWDIIEEGNIFKRAWFKVVDKIPDDIVATVRAWDAAATPVTASNPDPDWTAGCKMSRTKRNTVFVHDRKRLRGGPSEVEQLMLRTAEADGVGVDIRIEQEPGAAGKTVVYNYANKVLAKYNVRPVLPTGDKVTRAKPFSAACERGDVEILRGSWNSSWMDHMSGFPGLAHDDDVDAACHAYNVLASEITVGLPRGSVGVYSRS